jgi:tetrapyrrole methylase family protein/MazG family protein
MQLPYANLEHVLALIPGEAPDNLYITAATRVAGQHYPQLDPDQPALITALAGIDQARRVAAILLNVYPATHEVVIVEDVARSVTLAELAAANNPAAGNPVKPADSLAVVAAGACLYVPPLAQPGAYAALQEVVARLRAPDGCPWDRELTWDKLRASLLEESHELLAALDSHDLKKVVEEQGDLLLQIAMQTQIAIEEGLYRSPDVVATVVDKLIRRHPHIFGDVTVSGTAEVLANWEAIKAEERAKNGEKRSPLSGVPKGLPALAQADAYLDRMSRLRTAAPPSAPWAELAALPPDAPVSPATVGKALFGLVAWAQARSIDSESALRAANAEFAAEVAAGLS